MIWRAERYGYLTVCLNPYSDNILSYPSLAERTIRREHIPIEDIPLPLQNTWFVLYLPWKTVKSFQEHARLTEPTTFFALQ